MTYQIREQMEFWKYSMKDLDYTTTLYKANLQHPGYQTADKKEHGCYDVKTDRTEIHTGTRDSCIKCSGITSYGIAIPAVPENDITLNAVKHDDGKADWSLVPFESLEGMVKVLEFGAKKYDGWNWTTNGGFSYMRVMRSCLRHLFAWSRGEDIDPESGLSHIHHAMCNLLFISHYIGNKDKYNKDDRQKR